MSYRFGEASPANDDDLLTSGAFSFPTAVTIACFFERTDPCLSGVIAPRILDHADALFYYHSDDNVWRFWRYASGDTGQWEWAGTETGGVNNSILLTYDGSSLSNKPELYINNSVKTRTDVLQPSGTLNSTSGAASIGNRASDNARNWDGKLERVVVWNVVLSSGERGDFHSGVDAATIQEANRVIHFPLLSDTSELILTGEANPNSPGPSSSTVLAPSGVGTGGPFPARYFAEEYWARRYFPGSYNDGAATDIWIPKIWIM